MKERIIYECEFCRSVNSKKRYFSKDRMRHHEYMCFYNPKNKTCLTCKHNERRFACYDALHPAYSVGCKGGAVTQELVDQLSMSELFGLYRWRHEWRCQKYEFDEGGYGLEEEDE